jgi:predicted metal-dependent phosphoesterase TrpH
VIDLHTHSTFSDGSDTPSELAKKAHDLGISAIALTDHDTTASHEQMATACEQYGIELVPGTEISLRDNCFPRENDDTARPGFATCTSWPTSCL